MNEESDDNARLMQLKDDLEGDFAMAGMYLSEIEYQAAVPQDEYAKTNENQLESIKDIQEAGGTVLLRLTFRLNRVAFSDRVQMQEDELEIRNQMRDTGFDALTLDVDEAMEMLNDLQEDENE